MTALFAPVGPLEALLVDRVTASAWRLNRVARLEAGIIGFRTNEAQAELASSRRAGDPLAVGWIRDVTGANALSTLGRYETHLDRGLFRALHELQRLQATRLGRNVPPPAVVDVEISSSHT